MAVTDTTAAAIDETISVIETTTAKTGTTIQETAVTVTGPTIPIVSTKSATDTVTNPATTAEVLKPQQLLQERTLLPSALLCLLSFSLLLSPVPSPPPVQLCLKRMSPLLKSIFITLKMRLKPLTMHMAQSLLKIPLQFQKLMPWAL